MHPRTWLPFITAEGERLRTLRSTASAPSISPHRHRLSVVLDILEVGHGAGELPAIDGLGGLAGVLEGDAQIRAAGARRFGGLDGGSSVSLENEVLARSGLRVVVMRYGGSVNKIWREW